MTPTEWAVESVDSATNHHDLVWVEDHYRLLDTGSITRLTQGLVAKGKGFIHSNNALRLREALNSAVPGTSRIAILDQSCTPRDPHLLPQDAKPSDLRPLPAPDWKPLIKLDAVVRLTIRDFLIRATGDERWPVEVNIFPYETLARQHPEDFVEAYKTFCLPGRSLGTDDLVMVGASAIMGCELHSLSRPLMALEVAFHSEDRWKRMAEYFNAGEVVSIRKRLEELPSPLGDLFGKRADDARLAVVSLLVLKQHFENNPGAHIPILSPALTAYQEFDLGQISEAPNWFIEKEIPRFDKMLGASFLKHLQSALQLTDKEHARSFLKNERFSSVMRGLVPFDIDMPVSKPTSLFEIPGEAFRLESLVPEFRSTKRELQEIVASIRPDIERLRLQSVAQQSATKVRDIFLLNGAYRIEQLVGRINSLIRDIEGPAKRQWQNIAGFETRWQHELHECRDTIEDAGKLSDELDHIFGKLLEQRYAEIAGGEFLSTDKFYEKFIAPRRRGGHGEIKKAIVLVIDSMRLDIWRNLVRPILERKYEIEETIGLARLPSETNISRRAFWSGKPPGQIPSSGKETDWFASLLTQIHQSPVQFEEIRSPRPGLRYAVKDRFTTAGVFDFPDRLSHEVDWDPHTLQMVLKPLLHEIEAVLAEAGEGTLVFLASDHGHVKMSSGTPIQIDGSDNVGYRAAHVANRIQGRHETHLFQIQAKELGHAYGGWYVFPKPGFYLRPADQGKGYVGAGYRHGGLSLFEVLVPLVALRHRDAPVKVRLSASCRDALSVGKEGRVAISISTDGVLKSTLRIVSDGSELESTTVASSSSTPSEVFLRITPAAPGKRSLKIAAYMGEQSVGETSLEINVAQAAAPEDEAAAKLKKLFGG